MSKDAHRRLRSKQLRTALWLQANGKCQRCGRNLPDNWHADHVVPWSQTHRTNVHEMQALCPECNLAKGNRMLRKHQREAIELCNRITGGERVRTIVADIVPGGGKSALPQILAANLIPAFADKICWVVPRRSLRRQGAEDFEDPYLRNLFGHNFSVYEVTNDTDPSRGTQGYVTTYDAIRHVPVLHEHEFARYRYILILDEPHHVCVGSSTERALGPMLDIAKLRVFMSGTFQRDDSERVAFLPYAEVYGGSVLRLDEASLPADAAIIKYTLRDALDDRALIPVHFQHRDASAVYFNNKGEREEVRSLAEAADKTRPALYTALRTDFAEQLLDKAVTHWKGYKARNPRSALLIVSPRIELAKDHLRRLRKEHGIDARIATSDDTDDAMTNLKQYRDGRFDVLVTVAMAYEGMDVKRITHIACLTEIRSAPWITQMIHRATRYDPKAGPYEAQTAHVFCPDDALFHDCIKSLREEQERFLVDRGHGRDDGPNADPHFVLPVTSDDTRGRTSALVDGEIVGYDDTARYIQAADNVGIGGVSAIQVRNLLRELNVAHSAARMLANSTPAPGTTPRQRMDQMRRAIQKRASALDMTFGMEHGTVNKAMLRRFGKPRPEMTEEELRVAWEWLGELEDGDADLGLD